MTSRTTPRNTLLSFVFLSACATLACDKRAQKPDHGASSSEAEAPPTAATSAPSGVPLELVANRTDDPDLSKLSAPAGFRITYWAKSLPGARSLARSEATGTIFVGNRKGDVVWALRDEDNDGVADARWAVAKGLDTPNGVAWRQGALYVAEQSRVLKFEGIDQRLDDPPSPRVIYDAFPTDRSHGWKYIAFGPDDRLYVPVGAPCNICLSDDPIYASITSMSPDGTDFRIEAHGVRNTVGFTWHPSTKRMWFTDNGRDQMGDDQPTDELNVMTKRGAHFGYPFCHQGDLADPEFGSKRPCSDTTPPAQKLAPHVASLGVSFYTGEVFPPAYRGQAFIAEHGSWNRTVPLGYRVSMVRMDPEDPNKTSGYHVFIEGWLNDDGSYWGRPVDTLVLPDGSMLVSDDHLGAIYRVSYEPPAP